MYIRLILVLVFVVMLGVSPVRAHGEIDMLVREIHVVEAQDGGTQLILRFPLTLAYANELAAREITGVLEAPFLMAESLGGTTFYRVDSSALRADSQAFGEFLLRDYRLSSYGSQVLLERIEFCVLDTHAPIVLSPGLAGSLSLLDLCGELTESPYVSDALVIVSVNLPEVRPIDSLQITVQSAQFSLPDGLFFETKITDHRAGEPQLKKFDGFWPPPVTFSGDGPRRCRPFVAPGAGPGVCVM